MGKLLREKPTLDEFPSTLCQIGAWTISSIRIRWSSDLDPGEGIEWRFVVETAFRLRDLLAAAGLDYWPKTTGVKGLHVMVPITPDMNWDAAHDYTRGIAERLARAAPDRYHVGDSAATVTLPARVLASAGMMDNAGAAAARRGTRWGKPVSNNLERTSDGGRAAVSNSGGIVRPAGPDMAGRCR